jgi:hypothetical protein
VNVNENVNDQIERPARTNPTGQLWNAVPALSWTGIFVSQKDPQLVLWDDKKFAEYVVCRMSTRLHSTTLHMQSHVQTGDK